MNERIDILGVGVDPIDLPIAVATIDDWVLNRIRSYVCITGAHGVMECRKDERLRRIHETAGMVTPDGMPLVWMMRLLGKREREVHLMGGGVRLQRGVERVYGPDLMLAMTELSARRGYRQYYYGGGEGVAEKLKAVLTHAYPALKVVGVHCPPFRELFQEEDEAVVAEINAAKPDIVWVGLSTPKQEYWMWRHYGLIDAPVMIGVGAAFDFLSGTKRQAPVWMQRRGLEWLFRLCSEPRRLWRRYARVVPAFGLLALRQLVQRRAS